MKIFYCLLMSFGLLAAEASAQTGAGDAVKLGKPQPAIVSSPQYSISNGPQHQSRLGAWLEVEISYETKPEEIDELTFTYVIGVSKKLLDGSVTYVNIPKGRDHFAVMYVNPRSLMKLTGGKTPTIADIDNVWITTSRQGQVLDQIAVKMTPIPNLPHLSGMVLNKNQTPFAPLFYDRYETIKATQ